ncbi:MAG: hypothetical protein CM15mP115_14940 [Alphaproteobacteria bacterium]|nr:MAG: hypothetical protein CM15mP115_14940 [Alphaproteobacteria bacterium]
MIRKLLGMVFPALKPSSSRRDELETLLADSSADRASFDAHEGTLLRNILGLRDLNASDVMIPRADIVSVGMSESFSEIIAQMTAANHSRLPVRRDTLDDIAGIIHIKDVFAHLHAGRAPDVSTLLRPALFVAPTIRLLDLLHEMRLRRRHLALVVDEFGGVDGLITIEDLVEEIVGEIEDEHGRGGPAEDHRQRRWHHSRRGPARGRGARDPDRTASLKTMTATRSIPSGALSAPSPDGCRDVARLCVIRPGCSSR